MRINNVDLHVVDSGNGAETIVFSHGMLISGVMFDPQVAALNRRYRCVVYDHRGQGQSSVPKTGYDMDTLTDDAIELIETLGIGPCHFIGLSMGGGIGLRLAIRRPDLLKSLIIISANADPETRASRAKYRRLNLVARLFGLKMVVKRVMPRQNEAVNETWICDKGRFADFSADSRLLAPSVEWTEAIANAAQNLRAP